MTASLALYNQATDSNLPDQRLSAPLIYAPDYICSAIVFGASYSVKMHLMGILLFRRVPETTEVTRSVIDRLICMFRQASSESSASPLAEAECASPAQPALHLSTPRSNPVATPSVMAARCAHALTALVKRWDTRVQEFVAKDTAMEALDEELRSPVHVDSGTVANDPPRGVSPTLPDSYRGAPQQENPPPLTPATSYSATDAGPYDAISQLPTSDMTAQYPSARSEIPSMEPLADFIASFTGYSQPGHIPGVQGDTPLPLNFDIASFHDPMLSFDPSDIFEFSAQQRWLSR